MSKEANRLKQRILKRGRLPEHIAIIMDGNGRWARKRGLPRISGHTAGVRTVKRVVRAAGEIGLKFLTLYTFSTENWKRPREEVSAIMKLLEVTTRREINELDKNNVRLITTGRIEELSPRRRAILEKATRKTKGNTGLTLNLALSYSGRIEILDAVKRIAQDVKNSKVKMKNIDESLFSEYLYTKDLPDPDLLIRTSGEMRISNFLIWQTSYTELYITEVLWPDFSVEDFYRAISDYQDRERRFGTLSRKK